MLRVIERNGDAMVVCDTPEEMVRLRELHQRGKKKGLRGLKILWLDAMYKKAPDLPAGIYAALYDPTGAIVALLNDE